MYSETIESLRIAYEQKVAERESSETQPWKVEVRRKFLELLHEEGKRSLLEVGAGTGVHSLFFKNAGLEVVATDLSNAMVDACRAKGLEAWQMDFLSLNFEKDFDAIFALNCFLHVAPGDLIRVLTAMRRVLKPNGLLFWGQYGGVAHCGELKYDHYQPKRFFSMLTDETLKAVGASIFQHVAFEAVGVSRDWEQHFQSSVWRRSVG